MFNPQFSGFFPEVLGISVSPLNLNFTPPKPKTKLYPSQTKNKEEEEAKDPAFHDFRIQA